MPRLLSIESTAALRSGISMPLILAADRRHGSRITAGAAAIAPANAIVAVRIGLLPHP
jgi:hypothetical protein